MPAWSAWVSSLSPVREPEELPAVDVAELRRQTLAVLDDCCGLRCDSLRLRLQHARNAQELWVARSEIFQLVAHQHCQSQAASRINGLLPAFEGWLPSRMLTEVQQTCIRS